MGPSVVPVKGGKVRLTNLESLTIDAQGLTSGVAVAGLRALVEANTPLLQMTAVDKLAETQGRSDDEVGDCVAILTRALLQLNPKVQLRNKIFRLLPSVREHREEVYRVRVTREVDAALRQTDCAMTVVTALSALVENDGVLLNPPATNTHRDTNHGEIGSAGKDMDEASTTRQSTFDDQLDELVFAAAHRGVTQLWDKCVSESSSTVEVSSLLQQLQQLVKSCNIYLQQRPDSSHSPHHEGGTSAGLSWAVVAVVQHQSCPLDLRTNCGQLLATLHASCRHALDSFLGLAGTNSLARVSLINGLLCTSSGAGLYTSTEGEGSLGLAAVRAVLGLEVEGGDGSLAVAAIRTVHQWTLRTLEAVRTLPGQDMARESLSPTSPLMKRLVEYIWLAWDHFLDSVKNAAKDTFVNFVKIQQILSPGQSQEYFLELSTTLLQDTCMKFRLSAVGVMVGVMGAGRVLAARPGLPVVLLRQLRDPALASHSAELLAALFLQHQQEVPLAEWHDVWLGVFLDGFTQDMQTYGYELLFRKLLVSSPASVGAAIQRLLDAQRFTTESLCLLIMCAKISRSSGKGVQGVLNIQILQDMGVSSAGPVWRGVLPHHILRLCLAHVDETVRAAALSLLCESHKSTELPEPDELELLLDFYEHNMTSQNPSYKQNLIKSTKRLLFRVRDGTVGIVKAAKREKRNIDECDNIERLKSFLHKLIWLMVKNLNNGANNHRRSVALQILELCHLLVKDCAEVLRLDEILSSEEYIDTLINCLDDSYETNKAIASSLLQQNVVQMERTSDHNKILSLVNAACTLASSPRPPDSLTAGYLFRYLSHNTIAIGIWKEMLQNSTVGDGPREILCCYVLECLEAELKVAEWSLMKAAATGPMYGLLLCVRMLLMDVYDHELPMAQMGLKPVLQRVLQLAYRVSDVVAPVVRNSSPEGHLPMDMNPQSLDCLRETLQNSIGNNGHRDEVVLSEQSGHEELVKAQAVSAQMLLLCAWRSIKEVSLIFGDMIQRVPLSAEVLTFQDVKDIGQYFITQLLETKHRGAFEQAYVGFGRVCERLWKCEEQQLCNLPQEWLEDVLTAIQDKDDGRLCATRRSAGVPFIVQAVLSAEPALKGGSCLKKTMESLLSLAEGNCPSADAKIHAFNVLRGVFKDTRLGDHIIPYVSRGVKSSIEGHRGHSWAERNSAALLFAALMTRMFGVKKTQDDLSRRNAMSALVFFKRYPHLYDFLRAELESGTEGVRRGQLVPALFPVLLLLARLSPAPLEGRSCTIALSAFTPVLLQCCQAPVMQLRYLASHALAALTSPHQLHQLVQHICTSASPNSQNALHGYLLCLLKLVENFDETITQEGSGGNLVKSLKMILWSATSINTCYVTRFCALKLVSFMISRTLLPEFTSGLIEHSIALITDVQSWKEPWLTLCQKQSAELVLKSGRHDAIRPLMSHASYEVRHATLDFLLHQGSVEQWVVRALLDTLTPPEHRVGGHKQEHYIECRALVFAVLCKHLPPHLSGDNISSECLREVFCQNLKNIENETTPEVISKMVLLNSHLLVGLFNLDSGVASLVVGAWLGVVAWLGQSEHDDAVRHHAAMALHNTAPTIAPAATTNDDAHLLLYEILLRQLQDDTGDVREVAGKTAAEWLVGSTADLAGTWGHVQPPRVIRTLMHALASSGLAGAPAMLLKLALKEDLDTDFGLTQGDDRVFDKGEMNTYREELLVAEEAVKALARLADDAATPHSSDWQFNKNLILPHFCIQLYNSDSDILLLSDMMCLLERDIEHVMNHLTALKEKPLFCVRLIDLWLVRLARRASLWATLHPLSKHEVSVVSSVVLQLGQSVLKTNFLSKVLTDLKGVYYTSKGINNG